MKKLFFYAVTMMVTLLMVSCNQNGPDDQKQQKEGEILVSQFSLMAQGMSANHKYVVGQNADYKLFFWNTDNGDMQTANVSSALYAVNNQGVAVGVQGDGEQFAIRYENGQSTLLATPDGSFGSAAWDITEDGEIIVGFYYDPTFATKPCYWSADGVLHELPYPTEDEVGFAVAGAAVRWVSADGAVILGYLFDDYSTWPAAVWTQQADGSYACDPICKDYFEIDPGMGKPYMTFGYGGGIMSLSDNGQWITLTVQDEFDPFDWDNVAPLKGARFNLQTKALEVTDQAASLAAISNDGTALGYDGESPTQRTAYLWKAGEATPKAFTDIYTQDELLNATSISPMAIAPDASAACGFAVDSESNVFSFVAF